MRRLATIRKISELRPIPGADRIEVAQVDGWECVVKKGEYNAGDYVVYIEVDSIVPDRPEFEFMRERNFRVRTIKLRKQISQGLVMPLSILPENQRGLCLDSDVTDVLGIKKYDPQAQQEALLKDQQKQKRNPFIKFMLRYKWFRNLYLVKTKSGFPIWIMKTEEERIQNLPHLFESMRNQGVKFSVTEKVDGQSATYYLKKQSPFRYEFGVCSRNLRLMKPDNSAYWQVAQKYNIKKALKKIIGKYETVVLQGEICGSKIQGNKYKIDGYQFFAFNLIYPKHPCTTAEMQQILRPFGIETVPIVEENKTLPETILELVEYAKGRSVLRKGQKREGVVMRNRDHGVSFKVINPDFLLEEKE